MRKTTLLLPVGALLVALTGWTAAAEPKKDPTRAKVKDICKDCVDPYNPPAERARFFKAAGVDNELDAKEFAADKTRTRGFVRKFDTWPGMLAFDKNANKTVDWFEADAYRRDVRKRVLAIYDKDKNTRLKGKEREAANRALAAGKLPRAGGRAGVFGGYAAGQLPEATRLRMFDKDNDGKLDADETAAADKWAADARKRREEYARKAAKWRELNQELRKKHDTNGDGQLDAEERKAYYEEYRERAKVVQWDTDGDGQLSDAERKEMETKQAEWKKRAEENRRRWMLQRWDKDNDGKMSQEETDAMEAQQAEMRERAEQYRKEQEELRKQHDTDGDGRLNNDERRAYSDAMRQRWQLRQWDKDKDGKLSKEETDAMEARQAEMRKRAEQSRREYEELRKQHDADGDGRLNETERKAYYDAMRQRGQLRRWDKNKDGRLDDTERKTMEQERARWQQPGVMINGRPIGPGGQGGVRIRRAGDGSLGGAVIIRRRRRDEQDE